MVTDSDTDSTVQVEIFPSRFLRPETAQRLLNEIYSLGGVVRMMVQGPNLPRMVRYGPARGTPIKENQDLLLDVGGQAFELRVKIGRIRLELESEEYIPQVKAVCERTLPFSCSIKRGRFFRDISTVSDYAKYGKDIEDKRVLGLVDPKAKKEVNLVMLSEEEPCVYEER